MRRYIVVAEKPSIRAGEKTILTLDYAAYSEAFGCMRRLVEDGWRITESPMVIEFPSFPLEPA